MTWKDLLQQNRIQKHKTTKTELDDLRAVVRRDLNDAALTGLSDDRKFATAYNAALQLSKMVVACSGYRVKTAGGHHQTSFEVLEIAMGSAVRNLAVYFDTCRRKRNHVDYDAADSITESEAQELLQKAADFQKQVEEWIAIHHPNFQ